jgi:hypothetical protein
LKRWLLDANTVRMRQVLYPSIVNEMLIPLHASDVFSIGSYAS